MWPFPSSGSSSSAGASTSTQADTSAPTVQDSPTTYFQTAQFDQSRPSYDANSAPSTQDMFSNPTLDLARLHPLAGLGKDDIEYLDVADFQPSPLDGSRALPSRGWSDDLCYGTGTTYLSGLAFGGMLGARDGLFRPLGVTTPTFRLRLNAVLNQITRRGSFFGNSAGTIALIYNIFDASIDAARGKHDWAGSIAAGGLSGALFKCTAGVRPMAISSGIMMALAATWSSAKKQLL